MKYKPERDIPKAVHELKSLSPTKISAWVRSHREEKDERGRRVQAKRSPQSISLWFDRHPEIHKKLALKLEDEELSGVVIRETLFSNGAFHKIPCIEKWKLSYFGRGGKQPTFNSWINCLKMICQGRLPKNAGIIEGWGLKHPRQLTLEDGLRYIVACQEKGFLNRRFRLALRNFFKSRNIEGWEEISGKQQTDAGKYAHLYVSKEKCYLILTFIKEISIEAYKACLFSFKTGARMGGVMSAHSENVNKEEHTITIQEKASRGKAKRTMEKFISQDLWEILKLDYAQGKIFNIEPQELRNLCKEAFKAIIPEKAEGIPMPFHFWRHMFAQHMLRKTKWNLAIVAELGGWTTEALERYYGKMPRNFKMEFAKQYIHTI